MSAPPVFRDRRGLFFSNISSPPGGVNVLKLRTVPGAGGSVNTPGSGVNMPILDPRDFLATLSLRDRLMSAGCTVALFTDPHWYDNQFPSAWRDENGRALPDPLAYRRQLSADIVRILRVGDPVVLDFEKVPAAWSLEFLVGRPDTTVWGYRGRSGEWALEGANEYRPTAWSCEPHQDLPVDLIVKANAAYLAQLYFWNMDDVSAWRELQWLAGQQDAGVRLDPADCFPIYDAKDYDPEEIASPGSYLFDSNRLAWLFQ